MPVWVFDEAHVFQQPAREDGEPTWIAELLAAFVSFRMRSPVQIFPICVVASTLWSATKLLHTGSRKAKILDLQLLPLSKEQSSAIFDHVYRRIAGAAQLPQSQPLQSSAPEDWPEMGKWLTPSVPLNPPLAMDTVDVLKLANGNPRMLALACSAVAGHSAPGREKQLSPQAFSRIIETFKNMGSSGGS